MTEKTQTQLSAGTLIHIGPIGQTRLDEYKASQFQKVVILEPERERAAQLIIGLSKDTNIKVFHGALAQHEGEGELLRWNLDQFCSIREATPMLTELLPGLRVISREPVPLISPSRLLDLIGASPLPLHLVVSFLGHEKDALLAWKATGLLDKTCFIEVRSMQEQLFENAETRDAIEQWLIQQGFSLSGCDESDPDWPIMQFGVNELALELNATKSTIAQLAEELSQQEAYVAEAQAAADQAAKRNAELQQALDTAQAEAQDKDARIAALESELTATASKAEQSGQQLAEREQALAEQQTRLAEVEAHLAARDATLAALKADLAEREAALAEARTAANEAGSRAANLQQALDTAQAEAQDKDARIAALESELTATASKAEWRRTRIGELEQLAKDLENRIADASHKAEKAHADLSVATRMQALLQTDLNDLRAQLEEAQEIRAAQEALLTKLTPRLQQAADQLRLLQLGQDEDSPAIKSAAVSLMGSEPAQTRASKRSRSRRGADAASTTY
jgi:hypothetical protein